MCGIAGLINKGEMPVSDTLLEMLSLIQHRGPDASGIAVFLPEKTIGIRVSLTSMKKHQVLMETIKDYGNIVSETTYEGGNFMFFDGTITVEEQKITALHEAINNTAGLYVHSLGKGVKVYKDGGTTKRLMDLHNVPTASATHGIGHVRMATESAEDINAAHPFVSPFYSELAIVHNGQFTNYFNLRRSLENKGAIFKTLNDSEAASHYIAWQLKENGGDLEQALHNALEDLDGIFCILAATPTQVGFVKDKLGIKPLLLFEKDGVTLMGSEQIEFTSIYEDVYAEEMDPGEVRVWKL